MVRESTLGTLSRLGAGQLGVFRGRDAVAHGVSRKQLGTLVHAGVIERVLADTYRMTAVHPSAEQSLRAALAWAGDRAVAAGRSAAMLYGFEGVRALTPEIALPRSDRHRAPGVVVHRVESRAALMVRRHRGLAVTGVEATLVALGAMLSGEEFEAACEDARRRGFTSVSALGAYIDRFGCSGRGGVSATRRLLHALDPSTPSRSLLEVKTRRLLVDHDLGDFVRELPLEWGGRTYRFDFAFPRHRTILETNGRRWHDDPTDFEHDQEKWSVPARHGYCIVFATWESVTRHPQRLIRDLVATFDR